MLVTVQIDLAKDGSLLQLAHNNNKIIAMMHIYDVTGEESKLNDIGCRLWRMSDYADQIWRICEDDVFDFIQSTAWLFEFKTSESNAILFVTAFTHPGIVSVVRPRVMGRSDLE